MNVELSFHVFCFHLRIHCECMIRTVAHKIPPILLHNHTTCRTCDAWRQDEVTGGKEIAKNQTHKEKCDTSNAPASKSTCCQMSLWRVCFSLRSRAYKFIVGHTCLCAWSGTGAAWTISSLTTLSLSYCRGTITTPVLLRVVRHLNKLQMFKPENENEQIDIAAVVLALPKPRSLR